MIAPMQSVVRSLAIVGAVVFWTAATTDAHDIIPGAPQTAPILIRNATVHDGDGGVIDDGDVLFDRGTITRVTEHIDAPENATVIDGAGRHVYPGLIDAYTNIGLREITAVDVTIDDHERGRDNPNVRSWLAFNPDSELIPVGRAGGVLAAHVVPDGPFWKGQSAVMMLDGWSAEEMLVRGPAGLCIDWESMVPRVDRHGVNGSPNSSADRNHAKQRAEKANERFDEFIKRLDEAARYDRATHSNPSTPTDLRLASLVPYTRNQGKIFVWANRWEAIVSAVEVLAARGMQIVICGGADSGRCAERLRDREVPVIITATHRLPRRRHDAYDDAYTLPARLHDAGVRFAIAGEGAGYPGGASNLRNLPHHAATAVAHGLPAEAAVAAMTGAAAGILGVDDSIGVLRKDHSATLIMTDGDLLESTTRVIDAYVHGRRVDLDNRHRQLHRKYRTKYERQQP